jgi:hypothetical protein
MIMSSVLYQYQHFATKWETCSSLQLPTTVNYLVHFYSNILPYNFANSLTHFSLIKLIKSIMFWDELKQLVYKSQSDLFQSLELLQQRSENVWLSVPRDIWSATDEWQIQVPDTTPPKNGHLFNITSGLKI